MIRIVLLLLAAPLLARVASAGQRGRYERKRALKKHGKKEAGGGKKSRSNIRCEREVYSFATPNETEEWKDHTFHAQVWYHSLETVHKLWLDGYFDYVIDVRGIDPFYFEPGDGSIVELNGWEHSHIPGSFPTFVNCFEEGCPTYNLQDFLSSKICLDSRIYVHCWSGVFANAAVEKMVQMGFTNLHASGPEGSAGFIQWVENGWEIVEGDVWSPDLIPACSRMC